MCGITLYQNIIWLATIRDVSVGIDLLSWFWISYEASTKIITGKRWSGLFPLQGLPRKSAKVLVERGHFTT